MMGRALPSLSICIPTHHGRAATLMEAIESVCQQVTDEEAEMVEICISDNASADGTAELIDRLRGHPRVPIRYQRNRSDLGPARNTLGVVEMARGDYCWILSSDDLLADGALRRVFDLLDEHAGIVAMTVDQTVFNAIKGFDAPATWFDNRPTGSEVRLVTGTETIVEELGLLFSGISLHIFDRRAWTQVANDHRDEVLGGHGLFAHAVILARLARESPRWLWCPEALIRYRAGSGWTGEVDITTWVGRFLDDLSRALRSQLDESGYRRAIHRFARGICHPASILALRRQPGTTLRTDLFLARVLFRRARWIDGFWSETVPALLIPRCAAGLPATAARAVRVAMRVYRRLAGRSPFRARLTAESPARVAADTFEWVRVTIENQGLPLRTWWPLLPLYVSGRWRRQRREIDDPKPFPARINHILRRGRTTELLLRTPTPPESGRYELSVSLSWNGIWLEELEWSGFVEVEPQRSGASL